jgi:mannose-6-phosphate isomerase
MPTLQGLRLIPEYRHRVWGGQRLRPNADPYGEAWIVYEENRIASGPEAGRTLAEVAETYGADLLGQRAMERTGKRFPLLIKLLDTAEWLSLQVHPDDEQAERLEGAGQFGKTEAWHILDAEPGAEVLCGLQPQTPAETVAQAIREGTIVDRMQHVPVRAGDTVFVRAGTIHALGPGLLLYEVQQTSDITYRVFDWNRPQSAGRALHIDQSMEVAKPQAEGRAKPLPPVPDGGQVTLLECPYFTLETLAGHSHAVSLDTGGGSFHALTVIEGEARVAGDGWTETLGRFETVVIPASSGRYDVEPAGQFRALKASVE